jgi:hypothetical protein
LGLNWEENISVGDEDWFSSLEESLAAAPVKFVYCYVNQTSGFFFGEVE